MGEHVRDQYGNNVGRLLSYSLNMSSIPLDPTDTNTQVANFSATLGDLDVAPRSLGGKQVVLADWTNTETAARISGVSSSSPSSASIDTATLLDRLNTEQTTLPLINTSVEMVLRHWCLMAGAPSHRVPDNLLHCIDGTDGRLPVFGYWADGIDKWAYGGTWGSVKPAMVPYSPTQSAAAAPLDVNPAQSVLLGVKFYTDYALSEAQVECSVAQSQAVVTYKIRREGTKWTLYENKGYTTDVALVSATYTLQGADPFVFVLARANASDPTKVDLTLRIIEDATTFASPYNGSLVTDTTVTGVSSWLTQRPAPKTLLMGYDTSKTSGYATYGAPRFLSISDADALPDEYPVQQVRYSDGQTLEGASPLSAVPGFTGNVWERMRQFCSIYEIDMSYSGNSLLFEDRKWATTDKADGTSFVPALNVRHGKVSESLQDRERARRVEVEWAKYTGTPSDYDNALLWKADAVYSLEKGETKEETVQTDATFVNLANPVPVNGVPVPYTLTYSSYVITGNDGYIVDPAWWRDNGGSIRVEQTGKAGEIKLIMQAPNVDTVRAPYRVSEGQADRPALYIRGKGLKVEKKTLSVLTGDPTAAQEVGTKLEAHWITDELTAYNAAFKLACKHSGSSSSASFTIPKASMDVEQSIFMGNMKDWPYVDGGTPARSGYDPLPLNRSFYYDGAYFRTKNLAVTPSGINVTDAENNNTIGVVNGEFAEGKTVADWNALHEGKTVSEVALAPLPRYLG